MECHPNLVQIPLIFQKSNATLPWNSFSLFPARQPPSQKSCLFCMLHNQHSIQHCYTISVVFFFNAPVIYMYQRCLNKVAFSIFVYLSFPQGLYILKSGNGTPLRYFCLENPMDGGAWYAAVHGVTRVGHDWATSLPLFTFLHWRRKWQPTPVLLPGESQGRGSLVGCHLWGHTESHTTEVT